MMIDFSDTYKDNVWLEYNHLKGHKSVHVLFDGLYKVDMPNSITYLSRTLVFEWYVVRYDSINICV